MCNCPNCCTGRVVLGAPLFTGTCAYRVLCLSALIVVTAIGNVPNIQGARQCIAEDVHCQG